MIKTEFIPADAQHNEGQFIVSLSNDAKDYLSPDQLPLTFIVQDMKGNIKWKDTLEPNHWCAYFMLAHTTVSVIDNLGNLLVNWEWDPWYCSDKNYQIVETWALNNKGANGVVIGANDGMSGEWVNPLLKGYVNATLVEGTKSIFEKLKNNYPNNHCIHAVIAGKSEKRNWYESVNGNPFVNSMIEEITVKHNNNDKNNVRSVIVDTTDINTLLSSIKDIKWVHMDVEGSDDELIYAIQDKYWDKIKLLIYENLHIDDEAIKKYLKTKGFSNITTNGANTICIKK